VSARYLVGIDLGTTNTVCAFVDTRAGRAIDVFAVPQLVRPGEVAARTSLPSFLYLAGAHELPAGSLDLPWAAGRDFAVGHLAREQGARVPGRLVSSSKSWLCHGGVDRTAPILPWGAEAEIPRVSPVDASSRTLAHLREAWDAKMPESLAAQDVVLTVPASFDEVARELTLEAARAAGLPDVVLLEEPQAAFYAWLVAHERDWKARVAELPLVLVVDVGGGTTDLSLVAARPSRGELELRRVAVGEHLLLGGDNIDLALARAAEGRLARGGQLDGGRFHALVSQCRAAKEQLLGAEPPSEIRLTVPGRGGAVIGGALSTTVSRDEVERLVLDGFFPLVPADARPRAGAASGELGLPYAADSEITRHVADFLARQRDAAEQGDLPLVRPDALLFNGGTLEPAAVRDRLRAAIGAWHAPAGDWTPASLGGESLHLAVARGAAYFGLVRRGLGVRIGGGAARTYYLGLDDAAADDRRRALCLVPRGMEEGESLEIATPEFELLANRAVVFPLLTATDRTGERAGDVVEYAPGALANMPPIRTVLRFGRKLAEATLPVRVEVRLTEIGTLELWCRSRTTDHRWRLEFRLRDAPDAAPGASVEAELVVEPARLDEAATILRAAFEGDEDPVTLTRRLEAALGAGRDGWPLAAIRALWDVLLPLEPARARSPGHEARWLNLAGFLLRPGFGDPADEVRIGRLWRVLSASEPTHGRAAQCRAEWWNLWKRVAGGLASRQQLHLQQLVSPALLRRGKVKGPRPGAQELREMWQAIGSCERLDAATRAEAGAVLVREAERGRATDQELWALARLGARAPVYGPLNCVVARDSASEWAERLAACEWPRPESYAFALAQIARATGDRVRDLDPALRARVAARLEAAPNGARAARIVREVTPLEAPEAARLLDESLPAGLRLR
jgi:molecular chaperone DnaK (HSP70)